MGGIVANNTYPVEFLLENIEIQNNVISAAAAQAGLAPEPARTALVSALGLLDKHADPEALTALKAVSGTLKFRLLH